MRHLSYLGVLAACLLCVAPLAVIVRRVVLGAPRRLVLTLLVPLVVFTGWDLYAIHHHQWFYARSTTTGLLLPGRLPVEEALFFLVVPICMILTFETVRHMLPGPRPRSGRGTVMSYSALALVAVLASIALDLVVVRTGLLRTRAFWLSYAIILGFQLVVNGILTGTDTVTYDPATITGLRIVHAPVEDIGFGFAMTCVTLIAWTLLGPRPRPR